MSDMNLSLQQIGRWLPGARVCGDAALLVQRVHTDSRSLQAGDLFVALQGERFDAHDFLPQAAASGAVAALAQHGLDAAQLPGVEVPDSRRALGQLAQAWRAQFALPLIAVTGSNGKTTVTQMIASILRAGWGDNALATLGNLNNDIGVPQTLLRLRAHHRCAVVELGMNHPGEIAGLAAMAQASVALVNNAQREHQEFMGSVKAVAIENGHVLEVLPADGVAVFPMDDPFAPLWVNMAQGAQCCRFGRTPGAQVQLLSHVWVEDHYAMRVLTPKGELMLDLHMAGEHHVDNALACVACCVSLGVPLSAVSQGLSAFQAVSGRGQMHRVINPTRNFTLVDDTYNANPDSVLAAIDVLKNLPQPTVLVLGDMGEVGEHGERFHKEVGTYARSCGIDVLLTLGELSVSSAQAFDETSTDAKTGVATSKASPRAFVDSAEGLAQLLAELDAQLLSAKSIVVKGSRFMRMERIVEHVLSQHANPKDSPCS
jgi:UDP-N-acetylmuramoyl-tripeptide--D-alanyl-D-alanine ligase